MTTAGSTTLLYLGARFALADSPQAYVILAQGQATPVQMFERSPAGWQQAWGVFTQWEPAAQPAGSSMGPPPGGTGPTGGLVPSQMPSRALVPSQAAGPYGPGYPAPQGGPAPQWGPAAAAPSPSGIGVAGGITGIVGTVLSLIPLLGIVLGLILGPIAVILSSIGLAQSGPNAAGGPRPKGLAVTGLVLGILTIVFKLIPGIDLV